ncbi:hypothetical protein [Pandoraea sputorum]|uniref:hypothetical protein n=1 Tax=Pandoraea sputorum TaxID=93222 RepID=UPI0012424CAD|nr:hypothetical protein [Pandoraea sputorum]VVE54468.1 hypothetical protein PSP20601_04911 [Pandoraea sputorum]
MEFNTAGRVTTNRTGDQAPVRSRKDAVLKFTGSSSPITVGDVEDARAAASFEDVNRSKGCFGNLFSSMPRQTALTRELLYCFSHPGDDDLPDVLKLFERVRREMIPEDQSKFEYQEIAHDTVTIALSGVDAAPLTMQVAPRDAARAATESFRNTPDPAPDEVEALLQAGNFTEASVFERMSLAQKNLLAKLAAPATRAALAGALGVVDHPMDPGRRELEESKQPEQSHRLRPDLALLAPNCVLSMQDNGFLRVHGLFVGQPHMEVEAIVSQDQLCIVKARAVDIGMGITERPWRAAQ